MKSKYAEKWNEQFQFEKRAKKMVSLKSFVHVGEF